MLTSLTKHYINEASILKASTMIVDAIIVPGGISSTDVYVCGASKVWEEPGYTDFVLKTCYNRNLKLDMMCKITQLWSVSPFLPLLCQISYLVLGNLLPKNPPILAIHIYQTI